MHTAHEPSAAAGASATARHSVFVPLTTLQVRSAASWFHGCHLRAQQSALLLLLLLLLLRAIPIRFECACCVCSCYMQSAVCINILHVELQAQQMCTLYQESPLKRLCIAIVIEVCSAVGFVYGMAPVGARPEGKPQGSKAAVRGLQDCWQQPAKIVMTCCQCPCPTQGPSPRGSRVSYPTSTGYTSQHLVSRMLGYTELGSSVWGQATIAPDLDCT
jgi:hypothetical protein